jgi:prepilin-type N-terminal cleavage/methylation domain-containing protein
MARKPTGFTLIELLVVIGIIAALAAIIFPVFSHIRKNARRSVSASNLHQCWTALQMYCDDYDASPRSMPTWEAAKWVPRDAPTCDPNDTWRKGCTEQFGSPLVGSYGYARTDEVLNPNGVFDKIFAAEHMTAWEVYISDDDPPLMTSIYYADAVPTAFHGPFTTNLPPATTAMPNRFVTVHLDRSVRTFQRSFAPNNIMGWNEVFTSQTAYAKNNGG